MPSLPKQLRIVVVGVLMGAAEVVPGVSGGTIAFISGLYERLVDGIRRMTPMALVQLPRLGVKGWWQSFDISFLVLLFGSMLVSVLVLARGVSHLLENQPVLIWSFFFGLVVASIFVVGRRLLPVTLDKLFALIIGICFGVVMTQVAPVEAEVSPLVLFAGGCVAVCAWILPGLSGSFILLTLGLYQSVITAVKDLDFMTLAWVAAGCVVGLLLFTRFLSMLLHRHHDGTIALLTGFMVGSLARIWPWKHTTSYQLKPDGGQIPVVQEPVLPLAYEQLSGNDPQVMLALAACVAGIAIIVLMNAFALLAENDADKDDTAPTAPK